MKDLATIGSITAAVLAIVAAPLSADERDWELDAHLMAGHHDNFFFRGPGASAPETDLQQISLEYEHEKDLGAADLVFELRAVGTMVSDIDDADHEAYYGGLRYEIGAARWYGQYSLAMNRLFSEEGEPTFFDGNSFEGGLRYSLSNRTWLRGELEVEEWDFDPAEDDRDSDVLKLSATLRHGFTDKVAVRAAALWEDRDAREPKNNRTGTGWSLAFELKPARRIDAFLRYRSRDRDYEDAPADEKNFGRRDTVVDIVGNLRWWIGETWGVRLEDHYRTGDSTRLDRNFDGNKWMAGLFLSL